MDTAKMPPKEIPLFRFDAEKLHKVQDAIPTDLLLLRLRLRFGLPERVQLGQRFRVVVDLVDEMGQPAPESLGVPEGIDVSVACQRSASGSNADNSSVIGDQLVLKSEEKLASASTKQRTKWMYCASMHTYQGSSVNSCDVHVSLMIQMKQTLAGCSGMSEAKDYRRRLQNFCVGSAWLSERVLVLPLEVELQVASTRSKVNDEVTTSTLCQRLFRTTTLTVEANSSNHERSLIIIEENYGDAMGSHVWDASILLSFLVLEAGITGQVVTSDKRKQAMLELGSGCGLFASVLANLQAQDAEMTAIFTEKGECTERLQANLERNGSTSSAAVLPLDWGTSLPSSLRGADVRVVFAADVLYNWTAHEAFLATLDSLAQDHEISTTLQVFLAHKRRGKVSAASLDALACGTFDAATLCCASNDAFDCRWLHWRVEKLSSLGRVNLFRLTAKK